jgi:hypothetical protein
VNFCVAQLDEHGTIAASVRDKVNKADRRKKPCETKLREYRDARPLRSFC